ncbi:MAG: nuclear transport factor 2 family protein [Sphingobacteriales bacterium]|nr:nuclear transport factor 2 family protein [Sphingobacteriales bacterium]MBI3718625.1 nuclear transport factor 2 family protein [Sphingobacteriales bacterium]
MKKIFTTAFILCLSIVLFAQNKDADAVKTVLKSYSTAIEKLDTTGITNLFVKNSSIYEAGSSEGTIGHYLEHHLGPELKEFKSFTFSDYKVEVTVTGEYAFSTETYIYTIVLAKDAKEIKSKGVATSVLKKNSEGWKIVSTHSSFRKTK